MSRILSASGFASSGHTSGDSCDGSSVTGSFRSASRLRGPSTRVACPGPRCFSRLNTGPVSGQTAVRLLSHPRTDSWSFPLPTVAQGAPGCSHVPRPLGHSRPAGGSCTQPGGVPGNRGAQGLCPSHHTRAGLAILALGLRQQNEN